MSHLTKVSDLKLNDLECIKSSLKEMGFDYIDGKHVMKTYFGEQKEVDLEVVKDSKSTEIGFIKNEEGQFEVETDEWGFGGRVGISLNKFTESILMLHTKYKAIKEMEKKGFSVQSCKTVNINGEEQIELVMANWSGNSFNNW